MSRKAKKYIDLSDVTFDKQDNNITLTFSEPVIIGSGYITILKVFFNQLLNK